MNTRWSVLVLLIGLACQFVSLPMIAAPSDGSANLYSIEASKSAHETKARFLSEADQAYGITPRIDRHLSEVDALVLPLPTGEEWTAVKTDAYPTEAGFAWFGVVTAFPGGPSGHLRLLDRGDGTYLGSASLGSEHFLIWPQRETGEHELIAKAPSATPSCGLGDHPHSGRDAAGSSTAIHDASGRFASQGATGVDATGETYGDFQHKGSEASGTFPTALDILPLYYGSLTANDVANQYDDWIVQANYVFSESQINAYYRLASEPIRMTQGPSSTDCSDGLRASKNWLEQETEVVQRLRNLHGADFVVLAVPASASSCGGSPTQFPDDACGIATVPVRDGQNSAIAWASFRFFRHKAFSAIRLGCGMLDYTFPHELGHTFGAIHDDDANDGDPPPMAPLRPLRPYAFGTLIKGDEGTMATLMDCVGGDETDIYGGNICHRIPRFSSATQLLPSGRPIGDADHDNRTLVSTMISGRSRIRQPGGPVIEVTSPARGDQVHVLSDRLEGFAERIENVNGSRTVIDLSDQIRWKVRALRPANGTFSVALGTGREIVNADFTELIHQPGVLSTTELELIATVRDESDRLAQWRVPITVDLDPPVADFTVDCDNLECSFDASASSGLGGIEEYTWRIIDQGGFGGDTVGEFTTTSPHAEFFLPGYDSYSVRLEVEDAYERTDGSRVAVAAQAPSGNTARAGGWFNPQRSGHGIDFYRNGFGNYVAFWYTYEEETGHPTWYVSDAAAIVERQWQAPLFRVTWVGGSPQLSTIGSVALDFSDSQTAAFRWDFTLNGKHAEGWERFQHFSGTSQRTGAWYDPSESGWGLQVNENNGSIGTTLAIYDRFGQPRWVQGSRAKNASTPEAVTMPVYYYTGENLCPFASCQGQPTSTTPEPVGSIYLGMPYFSLNGPAITTIALPQNAGTWNRSTTVSKLAGY